LWMLFFWRQGRVGHESNGRCRRGFVGDGLAFG
jgi:hypothetical protein